jgi:hypothetical protein
MTSNVELSQIPRLGRQVTSQGSIPEGVAHGVRGGYQGRRPVTNGPGRYVNDIHAVREASRGQRPGRTADIESPSDGFASFLSFFGFPEVWTRKPAKHYQDRDFYSWDVANTRSPKYQKCDAELTVDGKDLVPLRVQSTDSLKEEANSTWERHYMKDVSTTLFHISKIPERYISEALKTWHPGLAFLIYFFVWIFTFAMLSIWFVSFSFFITFPAKA